MIDKLSEALGEAASHTLENLCLMFPDEVRTATESEGTAGHSVEVDFHGPFSGRMHLFANQDAAQEAAQNMLAADGEVDAKTASDVLCEIANVVCGNFLPALEGSEAVFDIGSPRPATAESPNTAETLTAAVARSAVDCLDGKFEFGIFLDEASAQRMREVHS